MKGLSILGMIIDIGGNWMAKRPVFIASNSPPYYKTEIVEFEYFSGFSEAQKQRSISSLHRAFLARNPSAKVLEISSKSTEPLGVALSAFNLKIITHSMKEYSVESVFQSCKAFRNGGPYSDIIHLPPKEAKRDERLKTSGELTSFIYKGKQFPITPKTYFYNWLYINTLFTYKEKCEEIAKYDSFTDISFNPEKSINCQAIAAAVYVSLLKNKLITKQILDSAVFLETVYGNAENDTLFSPEQMQFTDVSIE